MKLWQPARPQESSSNATVGEVRNAGGPVIGRHLEARLRRLRLRLESPDENTLTVKRVPASQHCYSKPRTNLLIKRCPETDRCFVCVDEDLEYVGSDQTLANAFVAGPTQQGWRVLSFGGTLTGDLSTALEFAFRMLEADEASQDESAPSKPPEYRLLSVWGADLSSQVASMQKKVTLFRDEEIEQVASCVLNWQGRLPLIVGEPGIGKSNFIAGVAQLLAAQTRKVMAVNLGVVLAGTLFESERESVLAELLRESRETGLVLALEQAEWAMIGISRGAVLLREALDSGLRAIAAVTPEHAARFTCQPLGSRLEAVRLKELCAGDTKRVLESLRTSLMEHHGVKIDAEAEQAAVERSQSLQGALPGKAVRLLDCAASRARLNGSSAVGLIDIYIVAARMSEQSA